MINYLNALPLINTGLIYNNYYKTGKLYFSEYNSMKIDTLREGINNLYIEKKKFYFLLSSLLESLDKISNTASVYAAYLKKLKPVAQKHLILKPIDYDLSSNNEIYNLDANILVNKIQGDILYLDPPYNHRQYGSNYHLLNTIALYDDFIPKGKTGLRTYIRSLYCQKRCVLATFQQLIKNANYKYIFLSYNNEGLLSIKDIENVFNQYGKYSLFSKKYKKFKSSNLVNKKYVIEYIHCLERYVF